MMISKLRLLPALLLAASLGACTVGDQGSEGPGNAGAADSGVEAADASGEVALTWTESTAGIAGIAAEMHFVSPTEIYAVINSKICMWNGTEWLDHTADAIGITSSMHFVTPTQIYAVVGNVVQMWDGTVWAPMTDAQAGINIAGSAEFHWVSDNEMYAVVDGTRICKWTGILGGGGAWADYTEIVVDLGHAMHFVSPTEIYATVGLKVCKWTGLLGAGGAWADLTPDTPDLADAIHPVSDTEIYAQIGEKICEWDGTTWTDLTEDMPGLKPVFHYVSDEDIYAIAGISVSQWALPAQ
jgi:hypothetical protein